MHDPARPPAHDPVITWASGPRIRTLRTGQHGRTNPDRAIFRYHAACHDGWMGRQLGRYARPKPHRQSRYMIGLPVVLAELRRIVHR